MRSKTEQKPETKTGETQDPKLDIQEIGADEVCDVVGGLGGSCYACGGGCSVAPDPPLG